VKGVYFLGMGCTSIPELLAEEGLKSGGKFICLGKSSLKVAGVAGKQALVDDLFEGGQFINCFEVVFCVYFENYPMFVAVLYEHRLPIIGLTAYILRSSLLELPLLTDSVDDPLISSTQTAANFNFPHNCIFQMLQNGLKSLIGISHEVLSACKCQF